MGHLKLRIFDAIERPLKPAYLKYEILEAGLKDQSEASQDQSQDQDQDQDLRTRTRISGSQDLRISDISDLTLILSQTAV